MTTEIDFLSWLDEQDGYYVSDELVDEKFPDLEFDMIGVTKQYDPETGKTKTPKRDYRQAVKLGRVLD
jgi:hypothetical protein